MEVLKTFLNTWLGVGSRKWTVTNSVELSYVDFVMEIVLQFNLLFLDSFPVLFCLRGSNIFPNTNKAIWFFTSKDNNKYMLEQFIALKILWMGNIWTLIKVTLCPRCIRVHFSSNSSTFSKLGWIQILTIFQFIKVILVLSTSIGFCFLLQVQNKNQTNKTQQHFVFYP